MAPQATDIKADEIKRLIAIRAYEMWENQGRPHGCEAIHWRQAEQDVMSCLAGWAPEGVPAGYTDHARSDG